MYAFAVVQRPTNSARPLNCPYEHILQCGTDTDTDTDTETHNQNQIHKVSGGITHANFTQMLGHCGIMNNLKRQSRRRVELTSSQRTAGTQQTKLAPNSIFDSKKYS